MTERRARRPPSCAPAPRDTGRFARFFLQACRLRNLLGAGSTVHAQFWSRDPGFAAPNAIGLTGGLRFLIGP